jgi:hypothetical protein
VAGRRQIPVIDPLTLLGERVAVSVNLHKCRPGKPVPSDAPCFAVRVLVGRRKASSSIPVAGYVDRLVLGDVEFVVRERDLARIQERGTREVCCFTTGVVLRPGDPRLPARGWLKVSFNPFRAPCFTDPDGECVASARFAILGHKRIFASEPVYG